MTDFSPYLEGQVLRHFLRGDQAGDAATRPTQYQMSVHSADPGEAGALNEAVGGSYARQPIAFAAPTGSSPTTVASNAIVEITDMPAGDWTHGFLWGDVSGTFEPMGRLNIGSPPQSTTAGQTLRFAAGAVTFDLH